jgi:HPt (histidine-containing phosphotransfer) domain-containing protein
MPETILDQPTFENLKAMMGADFIGELIDTYLEETPRTLAQLKQALVEGNAEVFRRSAHSIKSSSASFGAVQLSALAKELEMLGKEGKLDGAGEKVESLALDYQRVASALGVLRDGA